MAISAPTERYAQALTAQTATSVISPATTIPAGSLAVLLVSSGFGKIVTGVTDSAGNTYKVNASHSSGSGSSDIGVSIISAQIATQVTSGGTITVTHSGGSSSGAQIRVLSITGLAATNAFDKTEFLSQNTSPVTAGALGTLAHANEIIFMLWRLTNTVTTFTPDAGWTNIGSILNSNAGAIYQIVSSTASVTPRGTSDAAAGTSYHVIVASYGDTATNPGQVISQQGVTFSTWGGTIT